MGKRSAEAADGPSSKRGRAIADQAGESHNDQVAVETDETAAFGALGSSEELAPVGSGQTEASGTAVEAPVFQEVHESWESFEAALKAYAQATYQLYVIRTTTSVKRRNQRIADVAGGGVGVSTATGDGEDAGQEDSSALQTERVLIPERFQWYSKTLTCTHGWKDRHRGNGKRAIAAVRSTSCPVKMCVTLRHRGAGENDWHVVLTKHVRTHNHPLSKELFIYYMENRRIYDPELLAVVGDSRSRAADGSAGSRYPVARDAQLVETRGHLLQASTVLQEVGADPSLPSPDVAIGKLATSDPRSSALNLSQASGDLTARALPSLQVDPTSVQAPRIWEKIHASWEDFHAFIAEYSASSSQVFRTRSTVSVAAKNAKTVDRAAKLNHTADDFNAFLIPEQQKWYSKMLICNHGWKRKSRSKATKFTSSSMDPVDTGTESSKAPCPAMVLARLERDANNVWRVVINRHMIEHNHPLVVASDDTAPIDGQDGVDTFQPSQSASGINGNDGSTALPDNIHNRDDDLREQTNQVASDLNSVPSAEPREVVVRVPKLQAVYSSWDEFHASLKEYSASTYQLYRTRTTSSVKGRNQKIVEMNQHNTVQTNDAATVLSLDDSQPVKNIAVDDPSESRLIPEAWKWYSKTLTCTHGWKERRRGTGKRTAHVVRSTACPVKICATVQFMEPMAGRAAHPDMDTGGWRVVITKHVVDHNHNLSRELFDHYRENRRIYDPDLLAIDESNQAAVVKQKVHSVFGSSPATLSALSNDGRDAGRYSTANAAGSLTTVDPASMAVNSRPVLAVPIGDADGHVQESLHQADLAAAAAGASSNFQNVAITNGSHPVVILPYQPQFQAQQSPSLMQPLGAVADGHQSFVNGNVGVMPPSDGVATLAAVAAPHPQILLPHAATNVLMMNDGSVARQGFLPSEQSTAMFALTCRVHGPGLPQGAATETASTPTGDSGCTCYRVVSSTGYVPLVPGVAKPSPLAGALTGALHHDGDTTGSGFEFGQGTDDRVDFDNSSGGGVENSSEGISGPTWMPGTRVDIIPLVSEAGTSLWRVPRMARRHSSWETFHAYLDMYSAATYQLYRVRTTSSVGARNARIQQQSNTNILVRSDGTPAPQLPATSQSVPESYRWYSKTFVCTHGWKERRRGIGKRVSHNLRSTHCPVKVCATLQRSAHDTSKWSIVVTKHHVDHNHELSPEVYQQYSENRRVKDPSLLQAAEELWRAGSTRRQVFEFLKDQAQSNILMKDVHNLVQRWQGKQATSAKDAEKDGEGDDGEAAQLVSGSSSVVDGDGAELEDTSV